MSDNVKIYEASPELAFEEERILADRGARPFDEERDLPVGVNYLDSGLLFEERLYYKEKAFQQIEGEDFGLIDTWNTTTEFGKVDPAGMPIHLSDMIYLKQFTSAVSQDLFAINYVVDLFEEMVVNAESYIRKAGGFLPIDALEEQSMFPLNVSKAWQSPSILYHEHMSTLYRALTTDYLSNQHSKILIFEHFVKHFIDFCHLAARDIPITFSSFIQSAYCPMNVNGCTIEVNQSDYDDDANKFSNFFISPLFPIYKRMATTHGFMVDKNIPWRLVANLNHPKMRAGAQKQIMLGDDLTMKSLMKRIYKDAFRIDVELLKFHMVAFYNNYVGFMPDVDVPYTRRCHINGTETLKVGKATRTPMRAFDEERNLRTNSAYYIDYDDKFWLNFYYQIKVAEHKIKIEPAKIASDLGRLMSYYRAYGFQKTVKKILFDINAYRKKQNIKTGFFTKAVRDLIVYDELSRHTPRKGPFHDQTAQEVDDEQFSEPPAGDDLLEAAMTPSVAPSNTSGQSPGGY